MPTAETTATFTYDPANELASLKVGDTVEVVNSQGTAVGRYKVRRVESLVITTECGRLWTRSHGEWVSEFRGKKVISWPFPSIRKVTASAARSFVEKSVKEAGHGE